MNKISIIIPMLNEASTIKKIIFYLLNNSSTNNIAEIMVVDGGSIDNSRSIVEEIITIAPTITLLKSDKGRAKQMNLGAKYATGDILYFLHADSFPPKNYDQQIINEVLKGNNAGCFRMQFDDNHWWLRFISWFTKFNWRASRGGDQSLFITKEVFKKLKGYDESYTICEDSDIINKLYENKDFMVIQDKILTSSRRYRENGIWELQYHFLMIYIKKWRGASSDDLLCYYKEHII